MLPEYVLPSEMIAVTPDQIRMCTIGSHGVSSAFGNQSAMTLNANMINSRLLLNFVEPEYPSTLVQNMVGFPAAVERYRQ